MYTLLTEMAFKYIKVKVNLPSPCPTFMDLTPQLTEYRTKYLSMVVHNNVFRAQSM